jgi:eukaryotic-like serine/threonine-protein kinase
MTPSDDGRVGGRYELVQRIARGGGGTVWRAYDHLLEREVAVKHVEIPDELTSAERDQLRARVRSEARAAARLLHPSAVTIFDVVSDDRDVHLVLELVELPTLADLVDTRGPRPDAEVATIGLALLAVLEAAHERGIVHRDVKPSNIFVSGDGEVKLSDFGIAALAGETRLTRTGATMGSPSFVAPEQALGHEAAPAADLWGLGVSLYLASEGVPPFERSNAIATVHAVVHEPARAFERAGEPLREVLSGLLAKDPADRLAPDDVRAGLRAVAGSGQLPPPVPARGGTAAAEEATAQAETATAAPPEADGPVAADEAPTADAPVEEPPTRRRGRRWVPVALVVALLVVLGVALSALTGGDDGQEVAGDDPPATGTDPVAPEGDGDGEPEQEPAPDEEAATPPEEDGDAVEEADVPDDWQTVDGTTYDLAVPAGWEVDPGDGNVVDHRDPDTGTYLRVDWTDDPADDPVADWEALSASLAQRFDGYEEQRLEPRTFRGEPAALLEYTYTAGGAELRAYNLNVLAGDRAYALNLQSPAEDWDEAEELFPSLVGGFSPSG